MTYDAGTAVGKYILQDGDTRKIQLEIIKNYQTMAKVSGFKPPPLSVGGAGPLNQQAAATQQAAVAAQRLATERQKTAIATTNAARADQQLARDTANATAAQDRATQAALRRAQAQARAAAPGLGTAGGLPILPRTVEAFGTQAVDQFKSSILGLVGPAALVTTAISAIPAAFDLAKTGANADLVAARFNNLARTAGTTGDALLNALQKASGNEIDDLNLQLVANKANLLGVADSAQEFGVLMAIARDRAQSLGITTTQAFNDLVTGLGRGSALILDNLGIIVDANEINEAYAASLGKTAQALTEAEKKQALINAVIAQGNATLAQTGGAIEGNASKFAKATASFENIKNLAGAGLANFLAPTLDSFNVFAETSISTANSVGDFLTQIKNIGTVTPGAEAALAAFDAEMQKSGDTARAEIAYQDALAAARAGAIPPVQQATAAIIQGGGAYGAYAAAANATGIAAQAAAAKVQFFGQAATISAQASAIDAAAKDAQQAKTALVSAETKSAADAFIQLNPTMDAAAAYAAAVAQGLGVVTAQVIAFRVEANQTKADLIAVTNLANQNKVNQLVTLRSASGTSSGRGGGSDATAEGEAFVGVLKKRNEEAERLQDSRDQLALANAKTNAEKIAIFQRQLDRQTTEIGRNRILAQIASLKNAGGTAGGKGISALDKSELALITDKQARLDEVNRILAQGNLTQLQRNQYLKEQASLQDEVNSAIAKQRDLVNDIDLAQIHDEQDDIKAARERAGLERQLQSGRFSESQNRTAQLRLRELSAEDIKRQNELDEKLRQAGKLQREFGQALNPGAAPGAGVTPQVPISNLATLPPVTAPGINLSLTIQLNPTTGQATVVNAPAGVNVISILTKAA